MTTLPSSAQNGNLPQLARMERVNVRDAWQNEAQAFTPWLAQDENLQQLSESLSISLELESQEQWVGAFRADIIARNIETSGLVLIENQLEKTDHCHLGQIITYAAGLDAQTVVWIAERFTSEHRAAIDWLNGNTADGLQFFAVQIVVWRIGDSAMAPRFEVVAKPNEWTRAVTASVRPARTPNMDARERIKEAMIALPDADYHTIAQHANCGYSTVKKYAKAIREELSA